MPASASARVAGSLKNRSCGVSWRLRWVIHTAPSVVARQIAPVRCAMISPGCRAAPAQGAPRTDETPPPRSRRAPRDCPRPRGSCEPPHRCDQTSQSIARTSWVINGRARPLDPRRPINRRSPILAVHDPGDRLNQRPDRGVPDLMPVQAALARWAHRKAARRPHPASIELAVGIQHRHPPHALAELDRPIQRRRPTIPDRPRVHDQAPTLAPRSTRGSSSSETGTRSAPVVLAHRRLHRGRGLDHRHIHTMAKLGQRDPRALTETVMSRDQEQNPAGALSLASATIARGRCASGGPGGATCPGRSAEAGQVALGQEVLRLSVALCTVRFPC